MAKPSKILPSLLLLVLVFTGISSGLRAKRFSFRTDHFIISVDRQKRDVVDSITFLFENSYHILTDFFDYRLPKRIKVLLVDEDDIGNGAAFAAPGWVVISLVPANFGLRGSPRWLPNVIAHELAHIITLKKMGLTSKWLGMYLTSNWFHKRDFTVSHQQDFFIPNANIPPWLAEGLAQYGSDIAGYDTTDSHRSMLFRTALLTGAVLSLKEMSAFAGNSRYNEQVYNQGFFFVKLLYTLYGQHKMNEFLNACKSHYYKKAFYKTFARKIDDVYSTWLTSLDFSEPSSRASPKVRDIHTSDAPWTVTTSPVPLDKKGRLFLSSHDNDYGLLSLYRTLDDFTWKIHHGVNERIKINGARSKILFTSLNKNMQDGGLLADLWEYNTRSHKKRRITVNQRISAYTYSTSGAIICVQRQGGESRVHRLDDGVLIPFNIPKSSLEILDINTGRDNDEILITHSAGIHTDVSWMNLNTGIMTPVLNSRNNEIHPVIHHNKIYYAADYGGIYNLYSVDLEFSTRLQHTFLKTGAFSPQLLEYSLFFSRYGKKGFTLARTEVSRSDTVQILQTDTSRAKLPPPVTGLSKPGRYSNSKDGFNFLGFATGLGVAGYPRQKISLPLYFTDGEVDTTEPGMLEPYQEATAGAEIIMMHPGFESMLLVSFSMGQLLEEELRSPYLSSASVLYQNQFKIFTLGLGAGLDNKKYPMVERLNRGPDDGVHILDSDTLKPQSNQLGAFTSAELPLNRYLTSFTMAQFVALLLSDGTKEPYTGAGGILLGETLVYSKLNPGTDFINSGNSLSGTYALIAIVNASLASATYDGFFNFGRRAFFHTGLSVSALLENGSGGAGANAQLFGFVPLTTNIPIGPRTGRHMVMNSFIAYAGLQANNFSTESSGPYIPSLPPIEAQEFARDKVTSFGINAQTVSAPELALTKEDLNTGFILKMNSLFSQPVYWTFSFFFDLHRSSSPTAISVKLTL